MSWKSNEAAGHSYKPFLIWHGADFDHAARCGFGNRPRSTDSHYLAPLRQRFPQFSSKVAWPGRPQAKERHGCSRRARNSFQTVIMSMMRLLRASREQGHHASRQQHCLRGRFAPAAIERSSSCWTVRKWFLQRPATMRWDQLTVYQKNVDGGPPRVLRNELFDYVIHGAGPILPENHALVAVTANRAQSTTRISQYIWLTFLSFDSRNRARSITSAAYQVSYAGAPGRA